MKRLIQRFLRSCGLNVIRSNHPGARYVDHVPGTLLDHVLLQVFRDLRGVTFLQIGANDGVRNDPLYHWIRDCAWSGCMVEPMPDFAARLRELHQQRPQIQIVEAAVAITPGDPRLYRIDPARQNLPSWASGLATLDHARAVEAARSLGLGPDALVAQSIPLITPRDLLQHAVDPSVIVIDTEGLDIQLAGALLDEGCTPRVLHFEHACVAPTEWWAFLNRLRQLGYEFGTWGPDTTAFRPA